MRVLFLNTTGGFFGGVEQNIYLAASGLKGAGITSFFASENKSGKRYSDFTEAFEKAFDLSETSLKEIISLCRPDVIYLHKFDSVGPVREEAAGIPLVRMYHDHDVYCPRRHKYYFHNKKICTHKAGFRCYTDLAFLRKGPDGIQVTSIRKKIKELRKNCTIGTALAGSRYTRNELIRNGFNPEKIVVLPPCSAPRKYEPKPLPEHLALLYVGQLITGKGVDILLDAFADLLQRKSLAEPVKLHIVGTGSSESFLKKKSAELGIEEETVFHGWVPNEDLDTYYREATAVVVPSRWPEPFGMIGPEAMFHGRPVIAAKVGGIPDWLEDGVTGYLVDPAAPSELADAMEGLLQDRKRAAEFGKLGYARAEKLFTYDSYIEKLITILERSRL